MCGSQIMQVVRILFGAYVSCAFLHFWKTLFWDILPTYPTDQLAKLPPNHVPAKSITYRKCIYKAQHCRHSRSTNMSNPVPFSQANKKLVTSMYRQSLKLARNWISNRQLFRQKAVEIRHKFDQNAQIANPRQLARTLDQTRGYLYEFRHPDPITPPAFPGGTKYERNVPPRMEKSEYQRNEKRAASGLDDVAYTTLVVWSVDVESLGQSKG